MDSISIGKFNIKTLSTEESGLYVNPKNEEEQGLMRRFIVDGVGRFSIIIQFVEFDDGTAIVGLEGDYVGPRFIYKNLFWRSSIRHHQNSTWLYSKQLKIEKEIHNIKNLS